MIPYHVHSHYSILEAFCHIDELVEKAAESKFKTLCLTDTHTLSGVPEFIQECKKHKIKPVIGCEVRLDLGDYGIGHICLLAQNKAGWINLIKIIGRSYIKDQLLVINKNTLFELKEHLICFVGGPRNIAYNLLQNKEVLGKFLSVLNHEFPNFFISIEDHNNPDEVEVNSYLEQTNYKKLYGNMVLYPDKEDILYQQILTCSKFKRTMHENDIEAIINADPSTKVFFGDSQHHLRPLNDYRSNELESLTEEYDISAQPNIPDFYHNGEKVGNPGEFFTNLCRDGWKDKNLNSLPPDIRAKYLARVQKELKVFRETGLESYMLVIWDIINYARSIGSQVGLRGSAAGCIVSYLTGISDIDPMNPDPTLPYDESRELLLERFINIGRMSKDKFSPPDIDVDFGISHRTKMVEYVKKKYGIECVANIITFQRMDGKGALKEVFRVLGSVDHDTANTITSYMIDSGKVSDILEDLKEDDPKYNIINYCIDNEPKIAQYYQEYTKEFDIAIKLANTIKTQGRHAAGIVISNSPLKEKIPVTLDMKTGELIVALEMEFAEYCGAIKYDFLGVAALEKIGIIEQLFNSNQMEIIDDVSN